MQIALEPLHPVYAADRSCLSLLSEALDLCDAIEGEADDPWLGACIDVYHLWWDPNLARDIARAGAARRIFGFHVCDWLVPTKDVLNDRGMMGDGVIDVPSIRATGGRGGISTARSKSRSSLPANWWMRPMDETLRHLPRAACAAAT